jgi:response regulator RpfG family c-di-GMP phosphodiesterase
VHKQNRLSDYFRQVSSGVVWLVGWGLPIAISVIIATGVAIGELNHPLVNSHQEQIEQFKQSIKQEVMLSIEQAEMVMYADMMAPTISTANTIEEKSG